MLKANRNSHATGGNGIYHREHDLRAVSTAWVNYIYPGFSYFFKYSSGGIYYERIYSKIWMQSTAKTGKDIFKAWGDAI